MVVDPRQLLGPNSFGGSARLSTMGRQHHSFVHVGRKSDYYSLARSIDNVRGGLAAVWLGPNVRQAVEDYQHTSHTNGTYTVGSRSHVRETHFQSPSNSTEVYGVAPSSSPTRTHLDDVMSALSIQKD